MPTLTRTSPSYRHHKASGQAVVTLDGRDFYLGQHGTPESRAEYDRLIAAWLGNGRHLSAELAQQQLTVDELILAYWGFAERYYASSGQQRNIFELLEVQGHERRDLRGVGGW